MTVILPFCHRLSLPVLLLAGLFVSCVVFLHAAAADGNELPGNSPASGLDEQAASLLIKRCLECHREENASGSLALDSREGLLRGGDSGAAIDLESPADSLLLMRVIDGDMPPEDRGRSQALPDEAKAILKRWLMAGAPWQEGKRLDYFAKSNEKRAGRDWWSLQPLSKPEVPAVDGPLGKLGNPVDAFVFKKLAESGLEQAPTASRRTLIRRLYVDLLGVPPTHDEIKAFICDDRPAAWVRLVDRLLASPEYGERWGRYWLDLARYADTSGYERDQEKPFAWKYRDWVIKALNSDLSYTDFVKWQIAGDQISLPSRESLIATGFLRLGTWNDEPNDKNEYQYERLEDLVHSTSTVFFGLTVKCARCHDHKFDPVTQEDYYRIAASFWTGPIGPERASSLLGGPSPEELGQHNVLAWTDVRSNPPPFRLLRQGEVDKPAHEVRPGALSSIPRLFREFESGDAQQDRGSRLQLAEWILDPSNPLVDRVMVNRLWQHHFGQAIVRTPNNFGFLADRPTHANLLDWLAVEFRNHGRSLKHLHRLMLTSRTWMSSSVHAREDEYRQVDPSNRMWWRAERRRLDAESLRDHILAVCNDLNPKMNGPGFRQEIAKEALTGLSMKESAWTATDGPSQRRRSVYMYLKRALMPPLLTTFDQCDATSSCGQRNVSTVPTQALALLNHSFVHRNCQVLAEQIFSDHASTHARVAAAFQEVLGRLPRKVETDRALQFLVEQEAEINHTLRTTLAEEVTKRTALQTPPLRMVLSADRLVTTYANSHAVARIEDRSPRGNHAVSVDIEHAPQLEAEGMHGRPTLSFSGHGQYLKISGDLLETDQCTFMVVATDTAAAGHRELLSNWNGAAGNSTTSLFLGLTDRRRVRFSDAMSNAGEIASPAEPFLLTAMNGPDGASVFCNGRLLTKTSRLPARRLGTPWVIGTQGNIGGEYWSGKIAEIRVYGDSLGEHDRVNVERQLASRFGIKYAEQVKPAMKSDVLALASLVQVLMNTNEFLYVD